MTQEVYVKAKNIKKKRNYDDFGLRSPPVIRKTFETKIAISIVLVRVACLAYPGQIRFPKRTLNRAGVALVDIVEQTQQVFERYVSFAPDGS